MSLVVQIEMVLVMDHEEQKAKKRQLLPITDEKSPLFPHHVIWNLKREQIIGIIHIRLKKDTFWV